MLGEGVDYAVLDEAAIMPPNIWEQVVRPTLMDREGGALLISTPRGRNYFYKAFKRGQDPQDPEWASWQFPSWTNIHLPEGEIEEMRKDLPAVLFAQEVEAKFIAEGSSIFIIPSQIIQPLAKPSGHVVLGIDLAKTVDYTVIYGANAATRRNCYFERFQDVTWPRQRRRIIKVCNDLYAQGVTGITLMVDGTGLGDPMVDELEELGYDVIGLNFTTFKDKMVRLLAKDMEDGKAFIVADYVDEFESYQITQTPKGRVTYGAPRAATTTLSPRRCSSTGASSWRHARGSRDERRRRGRDRPRLRGARRGRRAGERRPGLLHGLRRRRGDRHGRAGGASGG